MAKQKNPHAVAMGALNKGGRKTMTPAARLQRIKAAKISAARRRGKPRHKKIV